MLNMRPQLWKDAPRFLTLALLLAAWSGCQNSDQWTSVAKRCSEVVHAYLESPSPVEIVGTPVQDSEGEVSISYRTFDRVNAPVQGSASCNFAVGDDQLTLVEASVGGVALGGPELEAVRKRLGTGS
ncbi:MAG: hypothetical protein QF890_09890 [Myxococcota bacterium]|nr:hypothetical protein [Deltaproteobacteria bacterium]MCP4243076.1 hypothetical protein [bacterium]MDP6076520.1 hypothetical protein [Myxococcota bacterium]MDP6242190.1 hypothetical protein [Myxococcota bacterium]MDP7075700.1 hypothetical protein [Myxococcota bacterium]